MRFLIVACLLALAIQSSAQPALDESDPLIAAVIVYSTSYSIERWEKFCASQFPSTGEAIKAARETWMDAHADLLTSAGDILKSQYSYDERLQIAVQARLTNDELEEKLNAASMFSRKDFCDESPQRIAAPQMDLRNRATLVNAIRNFTP